LLAADRLAVIPGSRSLDRHRIADIDRIFRPPVSLELRAAGKFDLPVRDIAVRRCDIHKDKHMRIRPIEFGHHTLEGHRFPVVVSGGHRVVSEHARRARGQQQKAEKESPHTLLILRPEVPDKVVDYQGNLIIG
jgi:hypothetical protein